MELKLNILSRLNINGLFPEQGNLVDQILIKSIKDKVSIGSDEAEKIGLKQQGTQIVWNATKAEEKTFTLNGSEVAFLKEQVKRFDTEKKITQDNVGLCIAINELPDK